MASPRAPAGAMAEGAVEKPLGALGMTDVTAAGGAGAGAGALEVAAAGAEAVWAESGMIPQQAAATIQQAGRFRDPGV